MNQNATDPQQGQELSEQSLEQIQRTKLLLEVRKLESDVALAASEARAKFEKLTLEVAELRRWSWTKPATMIPVLATVGTIAFAQYQGVFEIQAKRLDLEAKELVAKNRELVDQRKGLAFEVAALQGQQADVVRDKQALESERATLRAEVVAIQSKLKSLQQSEEEAKARAEAFEKRFAGLYLRVREIARVEIVSSINDKCGRAEGAPSIWSLLQEPSTPERSARDKETADRVFASDPTQCLKGSLASAKLMSELTLEDRSFLTERASAVLSDLAKKRSVATAAYAKYSSLTPEQVKDLPEPNNAANLLRPKYLDPASDFAWRVRYAKVAEVINYNISHRDARDALQKINWSGSASK